MAVYFVCFARMCSVCYSVMRRRIGIASHSPKFRFPSPNVRRGLLNCTKAGAVCSIVLCDAMEDQTLKKLQIPEPRTLTHEHLIKQACSVTVDSTGQLLTHTVVALLDVNKKYRDALESLLVLLEESLLIAGNSGYQEELWDEIVAVRALMDQNKRTLVELNSFLEYVMKMATSAAETSFLAGAEYASTAMCERINSAVGLIAEENEKTKKLETEYLKTQELFIYKATEFEKYHQEKKDSPSSDEEMRS